MSSVTKKGKAPVAKPHPDTPAAELDRLMLSATVTRVYLEALGNEDIRPADPVKSEMGKKKNHWAFRFIIRNVITYYSGGVSKKCVSVRASVEHPAGSLRCSKVTLKPMANGEEMSRSALAEFAFQLGRTNLTVENFTDQATPLLPFEYIIVARSLAPGSSDNAGTGARSRRNETPRQQLNEHPNGCRDFTAQWFIRLHEAGYVGWQAIHISHSGNEPREEEFHKIIGYRYSRSRLDPNPIAMARFPTAFQRKLEVNANLAWAPATGGSAGVQRVRLPYQTAPPPVQTFNHGGSNNGGRRG